jgi:futalosine hydrolase
MRGLIVAATDSEIAAVAAWLRDQPGPHEWDVRVTGVGMVATAAGCARALAEKPYDLALNLGLCGSFDPALTPTTVVQVVSDCLAELGAEDGDRFVPIEALGLLRDGEQATIVNPSPPANDALDQLPAVRGITVNTVHGHERSIAAVLERLRPQVESMEGAAFMYACLTHGVTFAQVRSVSNIVERRNRDAWRIAEAIETLGAAARTIIETL